MTTALDNRITSYDVECAVRKREFTLLPDGCTTVCQLTLDNGFTVTGMSACVAAENYDQDSGETNSFARAKRNVFEFLAFRLADRRAGIK